MKYDRLVLACHGCDASTASQVLNGKPFKRSQNVYDWLGEGIYFWEFGADRALRFVQQQDRAKIPNPVVVGALIQLGNCFDLMDTKYTEGLRDAYKVFTRTQRAAKEPLPRNLGKTPDKKRRLRDCAFLNFY